MFYVYILLCNDNTYYTGCTQDLKERFERHSKGYIDSTKNKLPVKLVYYCAFTDKYKAFAFEKYMKSGSEIAFRNKHLIYCSSFAKATEDKSNPALTALTLQSLGTGGFVVLSD